MSRNGFAAAALCLLALLSCGRNVRTYDLRCENLESPVGIGTPVPEFSWKIQCGTDGFTQQCYEIEVASSKDLLEGGKADLWKSGPVQSDRQLFVPYGGETLHSRQICWWRVKVTGSDGNASSWSGPQRFTVGVLEGDAMEGEYIGAFEGTRQSSLLRKKFTAETSGTALLYVNSLGYHEAYVNGKKASEAVLQPAVSQLDKRSLIVTYDVTDLLKDGENEIVLWTSQGWYNKGFYGAVYDGALVKAELDIDGKSAVSTDGSWQACLSGYCNTTLWNHMFGGETIDASAVPADMGDLDGREWVPADIATVNGVKAVQQMCEPCTIQETVTAKDVQPYGDSCWLVDLGVTMNGQFEITLPALEKGTKVIAEYSDWTGDQRGVHFGADTLIASGNPDGDLFREKFNHHVFRYVKLKGLAVKPDAEKAKAHRMRTAYRRTGTFRCSDDDINAVERMISYTMENLAFDGYMVDCASLERLGYGGDGNASTLSMQTVFAADPLYRNWLQAWRDVIREDGGLPHTAPCPLRAGGGPYWCGFIVQAPWRTYMSYADMKPMKECYPVMKHWLKYVDTWTKEGLLDRWPDVDYRGWYLGDWLAPKGIDVTAEESVDLVNNCSLVQCYNELEKIALYMESEDDAAMFRGRRDSLIERINARFLNTADSTYGTGTQLDMAYPLLTGVVPEEMKGAVEAKLLERCAQVDSGFMKVGLVGVPVLTEWATLSGHDSLIYGMLKKREYPGYLYMILNGGDTTWEDWGEGARSHLHNCYNGIGSWFYQGLGGIVPLEPGYRRVSVEPALPEGMEWVEVSEDTPYGILSVHADQTGMKVTVPVGVTAEIYGKEYPSGTYDIKQ